MYVELQNFFELIVDCKYSKKLMSFRLNSIFDTLSCWFFSFKIETIEREEEFVGEEDDQDNPDQGKIGL